MSKKPASAPLKLEVKTSNWWDSTKAWFSNSETIFLARLSTLGGVVTTAVGTADWSPIWTLFQTGTSFTRQQIIMIGIGVIGAGLTLELARRRNADLT